MIEKELKKLIGRRRRENEEKICQYRRELEKDLISFCLDNGGHYWWGWQKELLTYFNPEFNRLIERRICSACRCREEREVEEEKK